MIPSRYVSEAWFWRALVALSLAAGWYAVASRPPMRPTEPLAAAPSDTDEPVLVEFDKLTLEAAERVNGRRVVAVFTAGAPPFSWGTGKRLITVTGPRGRGSEERTVHLKGDRLHDTDPGAGVVVTGTLRVIRHPASTIGGRTFTGFTVFRIEATS